MSFAAWAHGTQDFSFAASESHAFIHHPITVMDVAAYLARVGFTGSATPDAETLRSLHLAHLYTVPFEADDRLR